MSAEVLAAALDLIAEVGMPAIDARVRRAATHLDALLRERGCDVVSPAHPDDRGGMVVIRHPRAEALALRLAENRIRVTRHEPDLLRFSVHATTGMEDLTRVVGML